MSVRHIVAAIGLGLGLLGIAFRVIDGGSVFSLFICAIGAISFFGGSFQDLRNLTKKIGAAIPEIGISIDHDEVAKNMAALRRMSAYLLTVVGSIVGFILTVGIVWRTVDNVTAAGRFLPQIQVDVRANQAKPVNTALKVSRRFRDKFEDLYDQVKGDISAFRKIPRRDMPGLAKELRAKSAMLPKEENEALASIGSKLQSAANGLARAAELFVTQGEAEVSLNTSGGPYRVGGMSAETEQMFRSVVAGTQKQIELELKNAKQLLEDVEAAPAFDKILK